jgi:hypothetical protein
MRTTKVNAQSISGRASMSGARFEIEGLSPRGVPVRIEVTIDDVSDLACIANACDKVITMHQRWLDMTKEAFRGVGE